ncbi:glycerol-3-phosphate 1-O-acyltransferase PlsY [bacterium]|nr:glycerol-3-phosphate 1-O-acyltransferase PlsY [bacterium]
MQIFFSVLAIIIAYLAGSIPTAYLMGRAQGIDIRKHGSGNVGATNAFRVLGKKWGIACLVLDALKGFLPVKILVFDLLMPAGWPFGAWLWVIGLAAIVGHMTSPFVGFKGGKGVATSLGVMLAIAPVPMLGGLIVALGLIWWTGYVSVGSIAGASLLPVLMLVMNLRSSSPDWVTQWVTVVLAAIIIYKHRANIARLRAGTENSIFKRQ